MTLWRAIAFGVMLSVLTVASLTAASPGWAADAIKVRGGAQEGFGRLVFQWRAPVGYTAKISGEVLSVRFDRAFTASLNAATAKLRDHVRSARISKDGRTALIRLNGAYKVTSFRGKSSIIVDFRPRDSAGPGSASSGSAAPRPAVQKKAAQTKKASQSPTLPVRVGEHPTHTRIVFDWKRPTRYTVGKKGVVLTVSFAASASVDKAALARRLPASVTLGAVTNKKSGVAVSFNVSPVARTRHFKSQNRVVVDILGNSAESSKQTAKNPGKNTGPAKSTKPKALASKSAPKSPRGPVKKVAVAHSPKAVGLKASPPKTLAAKSEHSDGPESTQSHAEKVTPPVAKKALAATAAPRSLLPKEAVPVKPETPVRGTQGFKEAPATRQGIKESPQAPSGASTAASLSAVAASAESTPTPAASSPEAQNSAGAPTPSGVGQPVQFRKTTESDNRKRRAGEAPVSLKFEWPELVGAAVFQRAGYTWIVFDKRKPLDLAQMRQDSRGVVTKIEQLPISNASVIRVSTAPKFHPKAKLDGFNWIVEFVVGETRPSVPIPVEPNPEADGGPELFLPATKVGAVMIVPDPEVGDELQIATLRAQGQGIKGHRNYPEFQLLNSIQGVVLQPLNDDIALRRRPEGLVVSLPGGLYISDIAPEFLGQGGREIEARRVFKLRSWVRAPEEDLYKVRQELQSKSASVPASRREKPRLELARFYFARGFAPESEGVLAAMAGANPRLSSDPEFKALRGAVAALREDYGVAAENLRDSRLDNYEEIELWRGFAAAGMQNWKAANLYFKRGDGVLAQYPPALRIKLGLIRANAALQARDPESANSWLQRIGKFSADMSRSQRAALEFLRARVAFVNRNLDQATALWSGLVDGPDAYYAAQSSLSLVNVGLLQETMPPKEAIERLEVLRYRWRGDDIELQILRRLGNLYLDDANYRKGLGVLRASATYFPDDPGTALITQKMSKIFKDLYLGERAKQFSPLSALALYDEFRELTPAGEEGNQVIQKLADRLVDVDLLNRAADLLLHQVKYRLKGDERAQVGAKLAVIRLLDRDPNGALTALRISDVSGLPEELEDDRRRIKARANFEMGDTRQAIELLAGDISRNADLLRADIHWRTENWSQAANVLQRLSGEPPEAGEAYNQAQAQIVLNWAVALQLSRDSDGLALLRDLYGAAMAESPLGNVFEFISSADDDGKSLDIETITTRIAASDVFEAFMDDYRKRLLKSPDSGEEKGSDAPAPTAPTSAAPSSGPTNG
ncbi:MAG: hypothetical protein ACJAU6_002457 [Alphaproteobacteria bacterium]|jgi:hypothetical protein